MDLEKTGGIEKNAIASAGNVKRHRRMGSAFSSSPVVRSQIQNLAASQGATELQSQSMNRLVGAGGNRDMDHSVIVSTEGNGFFKNGNGMSGKTSSASVRASLAARLV
jgi:hypothetical protein